MVSEVADILNVVWIPREISAGFGQPPCYGLAVSPAAPLPRCATSSFIKPGKAWKLRDLAEAVSRILALLDLKKSWQISNREWFLEACLGANSSNCPWLSFPGLCRSQPIISPPPQLGEPLALLVAAPTAPGISADAVVECGSRWGYQYLAQAQRVRSLLNSLC